MSDEPALVVALRRLTGAGPDEYRIGDETYWTAEQLQALLETRVCARLIQAEVELHASIDDAGRTVFVHGHVAFPGTLDTATATVVDLDGLAIDGVTVHDDGRLEFDDDQATTTPLLSGLAYDLYGAGADLLTSWSTVVKGAADIAEDGQSFKRSHITREISDRAAELRGRSVVGTVQLGRSDVRGRHRSSRTRAVLSAFDRIVG